LGGVNAAYDGLQLYLKENKSPGLIDGFTQSNVSLFLGPQFGEQNHVTKIKNQVKNGPTFSGMYPYVPTQNVDAFIRHLTLKGDGMYIEPDKELRSGSS
jgi:endothelin-converting enzyme/putative endopeptidase